MGNQVSDSGSKTPFERLLSGRACSLYSFLENNCVGEDNALNGKTIVERLPYYSCIQQIQEDIMEIRQSGRADYRKVESDRKGYYLARDKSEEAHFISAKLRTGIKTALINGDVSPKEIFKWVWEFADTIPADGQLKMDFGFERRNVVKLFSADLDRDPRTVNRGSRYWYDLAHEFDLNDDVMHTEAEYRDMVMEYRRKAVLEAITDVK
jgi:hypothetical protein